MVATGFCGCGAALTAAGLATGLTGAAFGATAGFTAALGAGALGATVLGAVLLTTVLVAGALATVLVATLGAGALVAVLAVVLAEFFVIMLLFLADVVLEGLTEAVLAVPFLRGAPAFGALATDERAVFALAERATAARDALADPAVTFLAFVFEVLALWLCLLVDTGCTRNCHASVR